MKRSAIIFLFMMQISLLGAGPPDRVAAFSLEDQFGEIHSISFPAAKPLVLTVSGQKGSSKLGDWIAPVQGTYEDDVQIAGVADLGRVPGFLKGFLKQAFRKSCAYPVMLDWSGEVARRLQYKDGAATLFVIGRDGTVILKVSGTATESTLRKVRSSIDLALLNKKPPEL